MPEERHRQVFSEINRVLKDDGYVFVAEDMVDGDKERKTTELVDRTLNLEVNSNPPHNYKNIEGWVTFFKEQGF